MATEAMMTAVHTALATQRKAMEEGNKQARVFVIKGQKVDMTICPLNFSGKIKDMVSNAIATRLLTEEPGTVAVLTSDSWRSNLPEGVDATLLPDSLSKWPKEFVTEVLMAYVNEPGQKGEIFEQTYVRSADGKFTWGEVTNLSAMLNAGTGRFVLDLTPERMTVAVKDLITKLKGIIK